MELLVPWTGTGRIPLSQHVTALHSFVNVFQVSTYTIHTAVGYKGLMKGWRMVRSRKKKPHTYSLRGFSIVVGDATECVAFVFVKRTWNSNTVLLIGLNLHRISVSDMLRCSSMHRYTKYVYNMQSQRLKPCIWYRNEELSLQVNSRTILYYSIYFGGNVVQFQGVVFGGMCRMAMQWMIQPSNALRCKHYPNSAMYVPGMLIWYVPGISVREV